MTKKSDGISDLPSIRRISDLIPAIRTARGLTSLAIKTGLGGEEAKRIVECADEVLSQTDIFDLPDRFNEAFGDRGWIATSSLAMDVMRAALEHYEADDMDAAEDVILDWVLNPETIGQFAINRGKQFNAAQGRWHQLRDALALTKEERYWSAVPLVLIAGDGFASDVLGTSPFEKNADLSQFDSMVAHPTALPAIVAQLTKGVRKSSDAPLSLPLRHGILHGRSLGYANRVVCGKAWMLMIALVDWAIDKQNEETRKSEEDDRNAVSWRSLAAARRKNQVDKQAIKAFVARRWDGPFETEMDENDPPFAFHEFLEAWQLANYGVMAKRAVNLTQQKHGKLAGLLRSDGKLIQLVAFEILSIEQTTVGRAEARAFMRGSCLKDEVEGEFTIVAFRNTEDGNFAMPSDEGGWYVQQGCMFDLMHERTT